MTQYLYKNASTRIFTSIAVAVVITATPVYAQEGTSTTDVNVSQNTVVVVPTPVPNEPAEAVVFYITDDRDVVAPGEIVTFRVVVRNQRNADINEVRITARIPDYVIPTEISPEAQPNPEQRTITWNDISLGARAEQTYAIRAQIAPNTPIGYTVRTIAEISGPSVRGSFTDISRVETKVNEQAAPTNIVLPTPVTPPPYPPAIPPTAKTGSGTGILFSLLSVAASTGLVISYRYW